MDGSEQKKNRWPSSCHESNQAALSEENELLVPKPEGQAAGQIHGCLGKVPGMNQRLTPATTLLLVLPPLLWAGNAVVGRLVSGLVPPMMLNFLRWALAFMVLLP
ncbi:MAG: hypothetical protein ACREXN_06555, partial [Polaromonas sp.]